MIRHHILFPHLSNRVGRMEKTHHNKTSTRPQTEGELHSLVDYIASATSHHQAQIRHEVVRVGGQSYYCQNKYYSLLAEY